MYLKCTKKVHCCKHEVKITSVLVLRTPSQANRLLHVGVLGCDKRATVFALRWELAPVAPPQLQTKRLQQLLVVHCKVFTHIWHVVSLERR